MLNEQYTKEEYEKRLAALNLGSHAANRAFALRVRELERRIPVKYAHGSMNTDVLGDYIFNSKNVKHSRVIVNGEHIKYSQRVLDGVKDCYDYTSCGYNSELIYESMNIGQNCQNVKFSFDCWPNCVNLEYCLNCHSSSDLFGCVGLRNKQYCILN